VVDRGPVKRWDVGSRVVWRSRPGGQIGYVFAALVIEDGPEVTALFQPTGAPCKRRSGRRGGVRGRQLLPGDWAGSHEDRPFAGPPTARVHPAGSGFAVLRHWVEQSGSYQGWYVNLERPWRRTPIGFDSHDDTLDITVADDLSDWQWKDEDELAWAVEVGTMSPLAAARARSAGEAAVRALERHAWPFDPDAWTRWSPPPNPRDLELPAEWNTPY
jgi:hypothetical protein